jgi:hypothetical protein
MATSRAHRLAAALGWAALLAVDARSARLGVLATVLGGIFPVPGWALLIVTLLFAALAAWSAAVITDVVVGWRARRPNGPSVGGRTD